ncbi:MAG: glutathione S-transferase family protein [Myxococcales bacterium]
MGMLVDGQWTDKWYEPDEKGGFKRSQSRFRNRITLSGASGFKAEPDRYHLYVSLACPWSHRAVISRKLKGLEGVIGMSVTEPVWRNDGWAFGDAPLDDAVNGCSYVYELYQLADRRYTGRATVPVLWDKQKKTIVSNESSDIVHMLDREFDDWGDRSVCFYPEELRGEIDRVNDFLYERVNNGVYRAGFATTQEAYDRAFDELFDALDVLERRLTHQRYLCGDRLTESDWRLFVTLVRLDPVYLTHFKCNRRRITQYPALYAYLRDLYQHPGVRETCDFEHIKSHYFRSHTHLNPSRIVPRGPELDLEAPHGRDRMPGVDRRRKGLYEPEPLAP